MCLPPADVRSDVDALTIEMAMTLHFKPHRRRVLAVATKQPA